MWGLQSGFNLGLLYTVALYWYVGQVDRGHSVDGKRTGLSDDAVKNDSRVGAWCCKYFLEMMVAFLFVMVLFLDGEPKTSLFMGVIMLLVWACWECKF